jgi:hypothetical protein
MSLSIFQNDFAMNSTLKILVLFTLKNQMYNFEFDFMIKFGYQFSHSTPIASFCENSISFA